MKGLSGIGAPKQQRFAMPFSYDARPSFWQKLKSNSHLVIAAVGTVALLGVAGTALWLAMPAGDRQAFAQAERPAAEAPAQAEPAKIEATGQPAAASDAAASDRAGAAAVAAIKADAVTLQAAQAEDDIATLAASDPRWSGATHKQGRAAAEAAAKAQTEAAPAAAAPPRVPTPEQAASVAAFQPTQDGQSSPPQETSAAHASPDKAETAAIPAAKPAAPASEGTSRENGHILRAVTMRSGPKKGAAAIGTIPAKAAVQVMSCKSWCQVLYKGKQGWIYKSFLDRD